VQWKRFDRELGGFFFTCYEAARALGLGRFAPFMAVIAFTVAIGAGLLVVFDILAHVTGRASTWPISQRPRSLAGAAVLGGYFIWDRFASPERIALLESLDSTSSHESRRQRRVKAAAVFLILGATCLALSEW
jgi:hypothetical protein